MKWRDILIYITSNAGAAHTNTVRGCLLNEQELMSVYFRMIGVCPFGNPSKTDRSYIDGKRICPWIVHDKATASFVYVHWFIFSLFANFRHPVAERTHNQCLIRQGCCFLLTKKKIVSAKTYLKTEYELFILNTVNEKQSKGSRKCLVRRRLAKQIKSVHNREAIQHKTYYAMMLHPIDKWCIVAESFEEPEISLITNITTMTARQVALVMFSFVTPRERSKCETPLWDNRTMWSAGK